MLDYSLDAQSGNTPLGKLSSLPPLSFLENRRQTSDYDLNNLLGQGGGQDD